MAEQITIDIVGNVVGVQYYPESSEAVFLNEMAARELGMNTLAKQAVEFRRRNGIPVPAVLDAIAQAETFRELM